MSTYNGWTNYNTWQIHLEFFDCMTAHEFSGEDAEYIAAECKEIVEVYLDEHTSSTLTYNWAREQIADVNYFEIAEAILER